MRSENVSTVKQKIDRQRKIILVLSGIIFAFGIIYLLK